MRASRPSSPSSSTSSLAIPHNDHLLSHSPSFGLFFPFFLTVPRETCPTQSVSHTSHIVPTISHHRHHDHPSPLAPPSVVQRPSLARSAVLHLSPSSTPRLLSHRPHQAGYLAVPSVVVSTHGAFSLASSLSGPPLFCSLLLVVSVTRTWSRLGGRRSLFASSSRFFA